MELSLRDFRWKQGESECGRAAEEVLEKNPDSFTGQGKSEGWKGGE